MQKRFKLTDDEMSGVTIIRHPVVQHKLSIMREKKTSVAVFCQLLEEISLELCFKATEDLPLTKRWINTPMRRMKAPTLDGGKLVFASVWRAGDGMLAGMRHAIPSAGVAHIGIYRDHQTLEAKEYYFKAPMDMKDRQVIMLDPMLATANSANAAATQLKNAGVAGLRFICLVSAPEGIRAFRKEHPDVRIYTAAVDSHLNERGYIIPGLGDAGDRIFGTK